MAEAAGLLLGVVALTSLFKDCVDLFSYFKSYQSLGRGYEILATKLDIEKTLLLHWACRVRLLESNYDRRLDYTDTLEAISRVLASVRQLLSESSSLQNQYGLAYQPIKDEVVQNESAEHWLVRKQELPAATTTTSRLRMEKFLDDFKALTVRMNQKSASASTVAKFRWIIRRNSSVS
jgi:hypothetical protein